MGRRKRTSGELRVKRRDSAYLARDSEPDPLQVSRTEGCLIYDSRGRRYIDFVSGWCVGNLGWGRPEVLRALREFDGPDYVMPQALYRPWVEVGELLAELTPGKLKRSYRATGGSEAVEIALQLAMAATDRAGFLSIEGSYHGNTLGAVSVGATDYRRKFRGALPHCKKLSPPLDASAIERVERLLSKEDLAAVIMEPICCNLAVLIPDPEFMRELSRLCRRHGTLLILDEVACGFGRTGKLFATEHYDVEPDILCLAKAITSGCAAMGATICTEEVASAAGDEVSFYSTFGWHPRSTTAALATLKIYKRSRGTILKNVEARSRDFAARLAGLPLDATVRVKGLAVGIEFEDESMGPKLEERCREAGLIVSGGEGSLSMFPPLVIDERTANEGLDLFEECVRELAR